MTYHYITQRLSRHRQMNLTWRVNKKKFRLSQRVDNASRTSPVSAVAWGTVQQERK